MQIIENLQNKETELEVSSKGEEKIYIKISDCIFRFEADIKTNDGLLRILRIEDRDGISKLILSHDDISTITRFKASVLKYYSGYISFKNQAVYDLFLGHLLKNRERKVVELVDKAGLHDRFYIDAQNLITHFGLLKPQEDESGIKIFWPLEGKGYTISSSLDSSIKNTRINSGENYKPILEKYIDGITVNQSYDISWIVALAWLKATLYSNQIHAYQGWFPILFVTGQKETGKTYLVKHLLPILGYETDGLSFGATTPKGLTRVLQQVQGLPVWVDEYRSGGIGERAYESIFRSLYNRGGTAKAMKTTGIETFESKLTASLILTGESMPSDAATRDRIISIYLKSKKRKDFLGLDGINQTREELSMIGYNWIIQSLNQQNREKVIEGIKASLNRLRETHAGVSIRTITSFAIIDYFAKDMANELEAEPLYLTNFDSKLSKLITNEQNQKKETSNLEKFFEAIEILIARGRIRKGTHYDFGMTNTNLKLHLKDIIAEVNYFNRQQGQEAQFDSQTIKKYIQEEFSLDDSEINKSINIGGRTHRGIELNYEDFEILNIFYE